MAPALQIFLAAALPPTFVILICGVHAQDNPPAAVRRTPFQNARILDGRGSTLSPPSSVLIKGKVIQRVITESIETHSGTIVLAGGGRTLMPGLIDSHWHAILIRPSPAQSISGDVGYNNGAAGVEATDTSMRGLTTVREVGGPVFRLKAAIDAGLMAGPRIYPSGAVITVTSGHGVAANCRNCRDNWRHAQPHGADWRQHGRRQP
jgi:imidazolonepropionase-like amidohydrolase